MAGGISGLSKDAQTGLQKNLASQSAPANPQTKPDPADRQPVDALLWEAMRAVPRAAERVLGHLPDGDPRELLYGAIQHSLYKIVDLDELSDKVDLLLERLFPLSSPTLKQKLATMFTPISPPVGPAGGAGGLPPQGGAGAATGQPPAPGAPAPGGGDAGVAPSLPA
jgi:hypothetical protein